MDKYVAAIDQGTSSTRFIVFNKQAEVVGMEQKEHRQYFPKPGWVEHDPLEIWENTRELMQKVLTRSGIRGRDVQSLGITNQRETIVAWDKNSGEPFCPAIVWQCTRSEDICRELTRQGGQDRFREITGLPVSTYFSGPKITWILQNIAEAARAVKQERARFGTIESWLIWWLTGGPEGGIHVTDVTNASRTMLMNLHNLQWEQEILQIMGIPEQALPQIVPSSDARVWGYTQKSGPLGAEVPVCAALGDQQAALVGQACFQAGECKNTFGTGCFLLMNTGNKPIYSSRGLLTSLAYQLSRDEPIYCLEGAIAMAGALVQWLRDELGIIKDNAEIESLAAQTKDSGGVYIVPAFSGLLAPYWRPEARGVIAGLTRYSNKKHLARAVLEATAFQSKDIVQAMFKDTGFELQELKVDGGMTGNNMLMQFLADILNLPVTRPKVQETTCLGAAYAAGLATGYWASLEELRENWKAKRQWRPQMSEAQRQEKYRFWNKAVQRSFDWME